MDHQFHADPMQIAAQPEGAVFQLAHLYILRARAATVRQFIITIVVSSTITILLLHPMFNKMALPNTFCYGQFKKKSNNQQRNHTEGITKLSETKIGSKRHSCEYAITFCPELDKVF